MTKNVGLDLDGILVGHPPCVSFSLLDLLYKDHGKKKLTYRFPSAFEQKIRQLSHLPFVRPPIKNNLDFLKKISAGNTCQLYVISGRFSFLEKLTYSWLNKYKLIGNFKKIYLNIQNLQPHLFKEKMLKNLKIDIFIDDDFDTLCYLGPLFPKISFYYYSQEVNNSKPKQNNIKVISNLDTIC